VVPVVPGVVTDGVASVYYELTNLGRIFQILADPEKSSFNVVLLEDV